MTKNRPLYMYTGIYNHLVTGRFPVSAYSRSCCSQPVSGFPRKSIRNNPCCRILTNHGCCKVILIIRSTSWAALWIQVIILTSLAHRFNYIENDSIITKPSLSTAILYIPPLAAVSCQQLEGFYRPHCTCLVIRKVEFFLFPVSDYLVGKHPGSLDLVPS